MFCCFLPVKRLLNFAYLFAFIFSFLTIINYYYPQLSQRATKKPGAVKLEARLLENPSNNSPFSRYLSQEVESSPQILGAKTQTAKTDNANKLPKTKMRKSSARTPNEVLVKFKPSRRDLKKPDAQKRAKEFGASKKIEFKKALADQNIGVYRFTSGSAEDLAEKLKKDPNVEYAEPNYQLELYTISGNDTYKADLWGLDNTGQTVNTISGTADADMDVPEAWAVSTGTSTVIVADHDTGVKYDHEDLAANMWDGSSCKDENGSSIPGGCIHGYDYSGSGDNDPDPTVDPYPGEYWHGSHVGGTIGAVGNNGKGIVGVARNVKIMALKSDLYSDEIVKAIDFAIQNGAKVMNASWGGYSYSQTIYDAINRFRSAGGLFIAAAGNSTVNHNSTPGYPCDYDLDNIICVAATDQDDAIAEFSDYGASYVDVGAPGTNILSSIGPNTNSYDYWDGTSMATPHVTGLAALTWSYNSNLTYTQVRNIILTSGDSLASLSGKTVTGKRVNAYSALLAADFTAPTLSGLTNDATYRKSKTWTWDSDDAAATYRYSIDQSVSGTPSGSYSSTKTASQSSGDGTYYIHVQAKDAYDNASSVTTVSVPLDNTAPAVDVGSDHTAAAQFTRTATASDSGSGIATYLWTKQSGTGTITFGTATSVGTTISASTNGTYVIRLTVTDNTTNSAYDEFTLTWNAPGPTIGGVTDGAYYNTDVNPTFSDGTATLNGAAFNSGDTVSAEGSYTLIATNAEGSNTVQFTIDKTNPTVNAGADSSQNTQFSQNATASDTLAGILSYQWSKTSGPGTVTFTAATSEDTGISANIDGTYVIRLTVTDRATNSAYDEFSLTWDTLGPDVAGVVDDSYYNANVTPTFTEGTATLNGAAFTSGTVISTEAAYTLIVTDGVGNATTVNFTLDKTAPTVNAGSDGNVNAQLTQNATVSDGLSGIASYLWSKTSGAGTITFGSATSEDTTVSASSDGAYVIRLTVTDRAENSNYDEFSLTWDTTGPTVTKLGNGTSDYSITTGGTATLTFNEALNATGKTKVQNALTAGADQTVTYAWNGGNTVLTINGDADSTTTFANDVTALVYDTLENLSVDLLLVDSKLESDQTEASTSAQISLTQTEAVVVNTQPSNIYVPIDVTNATVNVDPFVSGLSGSIPAITISAVTSAGTIIVEIPADTTITAGATWDAKINAPSIRSNTTVTIPSNSGVTATVVTVAEVGSGNNKLSMDKAARITIPNQSGKSAGYSRAGTFTAITTACSLDSQSTGNALPAGGDCKINSGSNLVIWTKHFTDFVTYDQVSNDVTAPEKPTASPRGGDLNYDPLISLTSTDASDFKIYMTLDNSTPDATKERYEKPFRLTYSATLKAIAVDIYGNTSKMLVEGYNLAPGISQENVFSASNNNVVIRWATDDPSRSRLVFDTTSHKGLITNSLNYGYAFSSPEENVVLLTQSHEIALNSLKPATTYYYRAVSTAPPETAGAERVFTTLGKKIFNSKTFKAKASANITQQKTATPGAQVKGAATQSASVNDGEARSRDASQNKAPSTIIQFLSVFIFVTALIGLSYYALSTLRKRKATKKRIKPPQNPVK